MSYTLLVGMQNGITSLENCLEVSFNTRHILNIYDSAMKTYAPTQKPLYK
jgi:hypothetical protein